jgi:hypothetical protein
MRMPLDTNIVSDLVQHPTAVARQTRPSAHSDGVDAP